MKRRQFIRHLHDESQALNQIATQISLREYESLFQEQVSEISRYNKGVIVEKLRNYNEELGNDLKELKIERNVDNDLTHQYKILSESQQNQINNLTKQIEFSTKNMALKLYEYKTQLQILKNERKVIFGEWGNKILGKFRIFLINFFFFSQ